jgi:hypothetical protein
VGDVQGVTQADKQASKALFEQFGDIALFGGKTGKEVLGDARVAEFGGSQGIAKLAEEQSAKAVAAGKKPISAKELEHSIRKGTVSATDKMVADLEALNKSTNDAQLASINLFNDGVNIFAKSVLLMEETRKQAASEKVQAKAEKLSTEAEQSPEFKKAKKEEEQANKALKERKEYEGKQKGKENELRAAKNLSDDAFEQIMAAGGDLDKKVTEYVPKYGASAGPGAAPTIVGTQEMETTLAKKYNLTEEQKEKFRSLAGDRKQREARIARGGKETIEEELQDKAAAAERRQKAIKQKAYDSAGPIEGAYVSGADSLRTDTEASIKDAKERKRIAEEARKAAEAAEAAEAAKQKATSPSTSPLDALALNTSAGPDLNAADLDAITNPGALTDVLTSLQDVQGGQMSVPPPPPPERPAPGSIESVELSQKAARAQAARLERELTGQNATDMSSRPQLNPYGNIPGGSPDVSLSQKLNYGNKSDFDRIEQPRFNQQFSAPPSSPVTTPAIGSPESVEVANKLAKAAADRLEAALIEQENIKNTPTDIKANVTGTFNLNGSENMTGEGLKEAGSQMIAMGDEKIKKANRMKETGQELPPAGTPIPLGGMT